MKTRAVPRPRLPRSLRGRVVVLVLVTLTGLLAGLFVAVDLALKQRLDSELRTRLTDRASLARTLAGDLTAADLARRLTGDGVSVRVCDTASGCVTSGVPVVAATAKPPVGPGKPPKPAPATPQQFGTVLTLQDQLPGGQLLTLSADASEISVVLSRLVLLEVVGGLVSLALAAVLLRTLVTRALAPLDAMTTSARQIAAGDAGARVDLAPPGTELGRTGAAFEHMVSALRSAEQRQRDLLSDASHELRTPLAGISATAELLLRDNPRRPDRERMLASLVRESQRAGRLVSDLLTMSRLDQGMHVIHEPIDLDDVLDDQVERVRLVHPTVQVITPPGTSRLPIAGDRQRLAQVIGNVLDNACAVATTITISAHVHDGWVDIDVQDDGPGIPVADRERVFQRLVRLDSDRSRSTDLHGGSGLGLTLARGLARAHGGDLTVIDGPAPDAAGACLRLRLPLRRP